MFETILRSAFAVTLFFSLLADPAQAVDPVRKPARTCAGFIAEQFQRFWAFANHSSPLPRSSSTFMTGLAPGIALEAMDGRDILAFYVHDLFERPLELAWLRTLSWPLRRRFRSMAGLEEIQSHIGSDIEVRWRLKPDGRAPDSTSLAMEVTSEYGDTVVLLFDEHQMEEGMAYYICYDIYVARRRS